MSKNPIMEKLRAKISPEDKILMDESFALADRIHYLLKKHNITQRQLADKLGKSESEVSKWLSGGHNFTFNTLAKIGIAIGERVYIVPNKLEDIQYLDNVLKSCIVRVFKKSVIETNSIYRNFSNNSALSELEVTTQGVISKKKHEQLRAGDFVNANLKPESFRNIEMANFN